MMHCREFEDVLITQIYGKRVASKRDDLLSHIVTCPACAKRYKAILDTRSRFERNENVPAPDWEKSWKAVLEGAAKKKRVRLEYTTFPRWAFAGGAVMVVFIVGLFAGRQWFFHETEDGRNDAGWPGHRDLTLDTYAERIEAALIDFLHRDRGTDREEFAEFEKKVMADMLDQTRLLKDLHLQEKDPQLTILLDEIECILMSISNLRSGDLDSADQLEKIIRQGGLNRKLQQLSKSMIMS